MYRFFIIIPFMLFFSQQTLAIDKMQQCILDKVASSSDETSIGEIKKSCQASLEQELKPQHEDELLVVEVAEPTEESTLVKDRLQQERGAHENRFAILPHKPNYILPITFNSSPNEDGFDLAGDQREIDNLEIKFQVSFKTPFWEKPFGENSALFFAYTGQSYWQAYNSDVSSPFRETNHQPEIFAAWATDWKLGDWQVPAFSIGVEHQSNGRSGLSSRSWNRLFTQWVFEKDRWVVAFRPWWRIPEGEKDDPLDPKGDDNPDIYDYMGYFELQTRYQWNDHNFGIMLRNNLRSDNKGAAQFDWTFPLDEKGKLRGYVQYFNGYGESLIDYNRRTNRLGVGFVLTDWL